MKRKLVKQGQRALTLTLPSSWVEKQSLAAGNEVEVQEVDDSLSISTSSKQPSKEIIVDLSGLAPRLADRFMARAYQKGYDKITLRFDTPELMIAVKNKVPELMGFEIMNVHKNEIEVHVISAQLDLDFDIMLRRAFLILLDMASTCHDAWKTRDNKSLENVIHQDFDVNRFLYFCLRYLNKSQKVMNFGRSILYYLIESLEDLGDELKLIGAYLSHIKTDEDVLIILGKLNEMFRVSYEFFYTPDRKRAMAAYALNKELSTLIESALESKDKQFTKVLMSIELSRKIINHLTTMRLDTLKELSGEEK